MTMISVGGVRAGLGHVCLFVFECGPFPVVPRHGISSGVVVYYGVGSGGSGTGVCLDGSRYVLCGTMVMILSIT